jgi:putative transposase
VTSNHIHLLVVDREDQNVIPDSIKLVAGRVGQEYNIRKKRKGAFWEDRYHATAVEDGGYLIRCMVTIDLNMVRNGVVSHPSEWPFCGYNEILTPRKKCVLIAYDKLAELIGFDAYSDFQKAYHELVEESLMNGNHERESQWTESIAVGSKTFTETIKNKLGIMALGRNILEVGDGLQVREDPAPYVAISKLKNEHIEGRNTYSWS